MTTLIVIAKEPLPGRAKTRLHPPFTLEQAAELALEEAIVTDYSLVHAAKGDRFGNLVFNKAARNFNPLAAMAGRVCIAQVEELVEPGQLDPDAIHLPGIYVHRIIGVGPDIEKRIERRTVSVAEALSRDIPEGA